MMPDRAFPHSDEFAARRRAADSVRWLENSGPRYPDVSFTVLGRDFADDETGMGDRAKLVGPDGRTRILTPSQMSFVSWFIVLDAPIGGRVLLKVRIDVVGQAVR